MNAEQTAPPSNISPLSITTENIPNVNCEFLVLFGMTNESNAWLSESVNEVKLVIDDDNILTYGIICYDPHLNHGRQLERVKFENRKLVWHLPEAYIGFTADRKAAKEKKYDRLITVCLKNFQNSKRLH